MTLSPEKREALRELLAEALPAIIVGPPLYELNQRRDVEEHLVETGRPSTGWKHPFDVMLDKIEEILNRRDALSPRTPCPHTPTVYAYLDVSSRYCEDCQRYVEKDPVTAVWLPK